MANEIRFYRCKHCGNFALMLHASGAPMTCCGETMQEVEANTVDAAREKHVPVVAVDGDTVNVAVGSVAHPMVPEHFIQWIYLETSLGGQYKYLAPGEAPAAAFKLAEGEKAVAAYEYCNLHGLWKAAL
ncbi:MAG TPA: desulfoferrodoxin family protein [Feifaniaceae bacterium]|nr:desulfoferrodoxin family protein [Feifaniaceae bacterium]